MDEYAWQMWMWIKNVREGFEIHQKYQKKKRRQARAKREIRVRDIEDVVIGAMLGWKRTLQ